MKKTVLILLFIISCTSYSHDCAEINDDYDSVINKCGKPAKIERRAGRIFSLYYHNKNVDKTLYVMFDGFEKVNYMLYKSSEKTVEKSSVIIR